jgi:hypothetical protein
VSVLIVVLVLLALLVRRAFFGYAKPDREFEILVPREVALIETTAEVMFPAGGAIPFSGLDADLPGYADRFLSAIEPGVRRQIRALFALFEHVTMFFPAPGWNGGKRFSSLSIEQREIVLQGWSSSPNFARQLVFTALRAVLTMGYLGHPEVLRRLRLAPYAFDSPIVEADLLYPKIGAHPDMIALSEEDLTPPSDGTPVDLEGPVHHLYAETSQEVAESPP